MQYLVYWTEKVDVVIISIFILLVIVGHNDALKKENESPKTDKY